MCRQLNPNISDETDKTYEIQINTDKKDVQKYILLKIKLLNRL